MFIVFFCLEDRREISCFTLNLVKTLHLFVDCFQKGKLLVVCLFQQLLPSNDLLLQTPHNHVLTLLKDFHCEGYFLQLLQHLPILEMHLQCNNVILAIPIVCDSQAVLKLL